MIKLSKEELRVKLRRLSHEDRGALVEALGGKTSGENDPALIDEVLKLQEEVEGLKRLLSDRPKDDNPKPERQDKGKSGFLDEILDEIGL